MSVVEYAPCVQNSTARPPIAIARHYLFVDQRDDSQLALGLVLERERLRKCVSRRRHGTDRTGLAGKDEVDA